MNLEQWQLERQRAWVAFMAVALTQPVSSHIQCGLVADEMLGEWEKRFHKPVR